MKIKKNLTVILLLILLLIACALPLTATAEEDDALLTPTLSYRSDGVPAFRAVYRIDKEAVAEKEDAGYRVVLGAMVGVGDEALVLDGSVDRGYSTRDGARAICVYATADAAYATRVYSDSAKEEFAIALVMDGKTAEQYQTRCLFRGFAVLIAEDGTQEYQYYDMPNAYASPLSLAELAEGLLGQEDAIRGYYHGQSAALQEVLRAVGKCAPVENPLQLQETNEEVLIAAVAVRNYITAARQAYATAAFADYTTSVVQKYATRSSDMLDTPLSLTLSWSGVPSEYTVSLFLSRDADFSEENTTVYRDVLNNRQKITNLYADTTYYWMIEVENDEISLRSDVSCFTTEDTVRWISVDGVRNVRDVGGWNGLNQGMLYRGSEMNLVSTHGLSITKEGRLVMRRELGIVTDMDLRSGDGLGGIIASPLGEDVQWLNFPIGNFNAAFTDSYIEVIRSFADPANYPMYVHCWGGADRTGTVIFIVEGLCGVSETDLSIDLELTSFSAFGNRYRYDNGSYLYATMLAKIKQYPGATLQEKFENYALTTLRLTRAEISNIQSLLTGNGATFGEDSLEEVFLLRGGEDLLLTVCGGQTPSGVQINGTPIPFTYQGETLRIKAADAEAAFAVSGTLEIVYEDGTRLVTSVVTDFATAAASAVVGGNLSAFLGGCIDATAGSITVGKDGCRLMTSLSAALSAQGYQEARMQVCLSAGERLTVQTRTNAGHLVSEQTLRDGDVLTLPFDGRTVYFWTETGAAFTLSEITLVRKS